MKLDTHLHNLVAQYINTNGNPLERQRLAHEAMTHMQVMRAWNILIDILGIGD